MLAGKSWELVGAGSWWVGAGGYFRQRITHQYLTTHIKDVIISVATITKRLLVTRRARMAMESVFPLWGINSRRTAKNAIQRIYIKYGNTNRLEMYATQGHTRNAIPIYTRKGTLLKMYHAVTI